MYFVFLLGTNLSGQDGRWSELPNFKQGGDHATTGILVSVALEEDGLKMLKGSTGEKLGRTRSSNIVFGENVIYSGHGGLPEIEVVKIKKREDLISHQLILRFKGM